MSDIEPTQGPEATEATDEGLEGIEPEAGPDGTPMVGVKQAARALGVTRSHAYAQIRAGKWQAVDVPGKTGGTTRMIPLAEVERLLRDRGPRSHGEVKPQPPDTAPLLQLEATTQRLEATRRVLAEVVEGLEVEGSTSGMGWWKRRRVERERALQLEAAVRAALAASGEMDVQLGTPEAEGREDIPST